MIDKAPPFKGLNTGIPIIIPITGRGFINQGSRIYFDHPTSGSGLVVHKLGGWA